MNHIHCTECGSPSIYVLSKKKTSHLIEDINGNKIIKEFIVFRCRTCSHVFDKYEFLYECEAEEKKTAGQRHAEKVKQLLQNLEDGIKLSKEERRYINEHSPLKYEEIKAALDRKKQRLQDQKLEDFAKNFETLTPEEQKIADKQQEEKEEQKEIQESEIRQAEIAANLAKSPTERLKHIRFVRRKRNESIIVETLEQREQRLYELALEIIKDHGKTEHPEYIQVLEKRGLDRFGNKIQQELKQQESQQAQETQQKETQQNGHGDNSSTSNISNIHSDSTLDPNNNNMESKEQKRKPGRPVEFEGNLTDEDLRNLPGVMEISNK